MSGDASMLSAAPPRRALPLPPLVKAAVLVGALAVSTATSASARQAELPVDAVTTILLEEPEGALDAKARQLAALGPASLPQLFDILAAGKFPIRVADLGSTSKTLAPDLAAAILRTFELAGRNEVNRLLSSLLGGESEPTEQERLTALRILQLTAVGADVELLFHLGAPAEKERRASIELRGAVSKTLETVLARDPTGLEQVHRQFPELHPALLTSCLEVLGKEPSPARLELLSRLLGKVPPIDALVLAELGRMGTRLRHPIEGAPRRAVRRYLSSDAPQLQVEAAMACAALEDTEAVPLLIDRLERGDAGVRTEAHRALQSICGKLMGADPERWRLWYARQLAWWRDEAPETFRVLRDGELDQASRVVLELSKRTLFRHDLTEALAAGLARPRPQLTVLICATLGHLGSWTAVPHLIARLEGGEDEARASAWRALRRITGADLGPDPDAWRRLLRSEDTPRREDD